MTIEEITTGLMVGKTVTDRTIGKTITAKTVEGTIEIGTIMEETTPNKGTEIEVRVGKEITIVMTQETEVWIGIETNTTKTRTLSNEG